MSERITADQIDWILGEDDHPPWADSLFMRLLIAEVQEYRVLIPEVIEQLETLLQPDPPSSWHTVAAIIARLREASQ